MLLIAAFIMLQTQRDVPTNDEAQWPRLAKVSKADRSAVIEVCVRRMLGRAKQVRPTYVLHTGEQHKPLDPNLLKRLVDLKTTFLSADEADKRPTDSYGYLEAFVDDRIDSTHLIAQFRYGGNGTMSAVGLQKSQGKWRVIDGIFPKATAQDIQRQAMRFLFRSYIGRGSPCYVALLETPPELSLIYSLRRDDPPANLLLWLRRSGYSALPLSKAPKAPTKKGWRYLAVSQVQRLDGRRALLQCLVYDAFGTERPFYAEVGYAERYAYLLATKHGQAWSFQPRAWMTSPAE